jgi:hypothetical protein
MKPMGTKRMSRTKLFVAGCAVLAIVLELVILILELYG